MEETQEFIRELREWRDQRAQAVVSLSSPASNRDQALMQEQQRLTAFGEARALGHILESLSGDEQ